MPKRIALSKYFNPNFLLVGAILITGIALTWYGARSYFVRDPSLYFHVIANSNSVAFGQKVETGSISVTRITSKSQMPKDDWRPLIFMPREWPTDLKSNFLTHIRIKLDLWMPPRTRERRAVWFPFDQTLTVFEKDLNIDVEDFDYEVHFYEYDSDVDNSVSVEHYRLTKAHLRWEILGKEQYRLVFQKHTSAMDWDNNSGKVIERRLNEIETDEDLQLDVALVR